MAIDFPNSPNVGDTHSDGGAVWKWNGYAWRRIPDPGAKGEPGSKGDKGQKGEIGLTGSQGDKGEKGAPSTVAGAKGQKGDVGFTGSDGDKGDKGVKGEPSTVAGSKGDKGDKGDTGAGTKGDKGAGSSVTIGVSPPTSPTPAAGDMWWDSDDSDLHVYYNDGNTSQWVSVTSSAALKGQTGDKGQKGEKGEIGEKGQKGQTGDKGQKGEIGATGGTGGTGQKGQKGAGGTGGAKGQKGEVGATGSGGSTGSTGQKGEPGSGGQKGQKGEVGAQGSGGSTGSTGQKGEPGANGSNGSNGDKGQKGEIGVTGSTGIPSGFIGLWSGAANAIPSGWYLCNGSNGTPDLRNRFVVGSGAGASYSVGDTGGANTVTLSINEMPAHDHDTDLDPYKIVATGPNSFGYISLGGAGGYPGGMLNMQNTGGGQAHENRPPYYALCYIMKS